jgi:tetratricopeptide (TPR) repeat protein
LQKESWTLQCVEAKERISMSYVTSVLIGQRRIPKVLFVAIVGFLLIATPGLVTADEVPELGSVPCNPIYIEGNAQLQALAHQGKGTYNQPYIIEGLFVNAEKASYCLKIRNVDSHFIVRQCRLTGASDAAIILENTQNGWIIECVIEGNEAGIRSGEDTRAVVVSANTFRNNQSDLGATTCLIDWDDGYLGNFWDRYEGSDENGDGIGDASYTLLLGVDASPSDTIDRFPLTEPLVGGETEGEGVLLQVSYELGDAYDVLYSSRTSESMQFIFPMVAETQATIRMKERVLSAPGNGFYAIEEAIVEDEGTLTINGSPEAYETSVGTVTIRSIHRLGIMPEPGYGTLSADIAGVAMPAQLPARRVKAGDSWGASWSVDAEALGFDEGGQQCDAVFTLLGFEEVAGEVCAIIAGKLTVILEGYSFDPDLGARTHSTGGGVIETTAYFSLPKGRIIKQLGTLDISTSAYISGMEIFGYKLEGEVSLTEAPATEIDDQNPPSAEDIGKAREAFEQGMALLSEGDYAGAERVFAHAADVFTKAGETELAGNALFGIGIAQMRQEKFRDAIPMFEEAGQLFHLLPASNADEAACFNSLGLCYRRLGEHEGALECYYRVLELSGDDLETQSTALLNIGVCLGGIGDYIQAIENLNAARVLKAQNDDRDGEIRVLINLGPCYRKLGQYERALTNYEEAVALCTTPEQHVFKATALMNRGSCFVELGRFNEAMADFEMSRDLWQQVGDPCGAAAVWITTALCQRATGDPVAAWASLEHAANLCTTSDIRGSVAYARGLCRLDLGDPLPAIEYFEDALSWGNTGGDLEAVWRCKWGLGKANWSLQQFNEAQSWYQESIVDVETVRGRVESEKFRVSFFETVQSLYEEYLKLLLEIGELEKTFFIAEKCRARTFLDILYQGGVSPEQLINPEDGIVTGTVSADIINTAIDSAQRHLQAKEAALEYMVTKWGVYLWVITEEGIGNPIFIDYSRGSLLEDVMALRKALEASIPTLDDQIRMEQLLTQFYERLVFPAFSYLKEGVDTLVFIPSGPLWYLPFSALRMSDQPEREGLVTTSPYLVEKFTVAYLPSLACLPSLAKGTIQTPSLPFMALANPTLSTEQVKELGMADYQYPALEDAARSFAQCLAGNDRGVYVQAQAEEPRAGQEDSNRTVEFYACHGAFNRYVPLRSKLFLAPGTEQEGNEGDSSGPDGNYHAVEALLIDHSGTELVVLGACESLLPSFHNVPEEQLRTIVVGDEVVGLARAFLSSGAEAVLGTLWLANPKAVGELLVAMCEHYNQGNTWAQALRKGQLELIDSAAFSNVWLWAPYQLIGRWR